MVTHVKGELTDSEITKIKEIFLHAIDGMGLGSWRWDKGERVPLEENEVNPYLTIQEQFFAYNKNGSFLVPWDTWHNFIYAYLDACTALDPWEMQTITNIEWVDAQQTAQDLTQWERIRS